MNEHIVRSYEDELNQLAAEVVRMGGLAEAQVNDSIQAFARRDVPLAQAMISREWTKSSGATPIRNPCVAISPAEPALAQIVRSSRDAPIRWKNRRSIPFAFNSPIDPA